MNVTLVRHPQTTANKKHIIYGKTDYPYTKRGEHQLLWVKDYMSINYGMYLDDMPNHNMKIISSPKGRALQLATAIGEELDLSPEMNENLSEMDFGIFEGLTMDEAIETYPKEYKNFQEHFDTTRIPEGESYDDFIDRMDAFLDHIAYLNNEVKLNELVIVSHGGVIRELLERLLDIDPGQSWKFIVGNGCIIKLVLREDGYQLKELIANKF